MRNEQAALADKENPRFLTAIQVAKNIAASHSSKSGYASLLFFRECYFLGLTKELVKNGVYKGALIVGAPSIADQLLKPTNLASIASPTVYHCVLVVVAGVVAASADVGLGGALDSWATYRATSQGKHADANYLKEVAGEKSTD